VKQKYEKAMSDLGSCHQRDIRYAREFWDDMWQMTLRGMERDLKRAQDGESDIQKKFSTLKKQHEELEKTVY
jgi:hypothetical protein